MKQRTVSGVNFIELPREQQEADLSRAVAEWLSKSPKTLPCRFFYDWAGSQLFEQICLLPEYYVTRTEQKILENKATEMIEAVGHDIALVEFGSGSSAKTRIIINAILDRQSHLHYIPIDISFDFLQTSSVSLLNEYERLKVTAIASEYNDALPILPPNDGPRLILFLGNTATSTWRNRLRSWHESAVR